MKSKSIIISLRALSFSILFVSAILGWIQFTIFKGQAERLPAQITIADIPVGGLDQTQAIERIQKFYQTPVQLFYNGAAIEVAPDQIGFDLNIDTMRSELQKLPQYQTSPFSRFWNFLWNKQPTESVSIPLRAEISEDEIRQFLEQEILPRYDQPATQAIPNIAKPGFSLGETGYQLDVAAAIPMIRQALLSPTKRAVDLPILQQSAIDPSIENLQIQLQQIIDQTDSNYVIELELRNLQNNEKIHFARQNNANIPVDIAFTAASTIKIPIMISVFRKISEPVPDNVQIELEQMINLSKNESTDKLMQTVLGGNLAPLQVTEDMQKLGLQNTFLAGYFYLGAPLLVRYETPANTRADINLQPDVYNQTTPDDIAKLLNDIYLCAEKNQGDLITTFNGEITQSECQMMIDLLVGDKLAYLITAGLPDGTKIAHKHGWIEEADGLLHTMSDVGIIYSPGGNYVLTIYMYHPTQLIFDDGNLLMATLSDSVYQFINPR